jgi:hypothetical protein
VLNLYRYADGLIADFSLYQSRRNAPTPTIPGWQTDNLAEEKLRADVRKLNRNRAGPEDEGRNSGSGWAIYEYTLESLMNVLNSQEDVDAGPEVPASALH